MSAAGSSEKHVRGNCCIVCEILNQGFSSFTYAKKKETIEKGRETPSLQNLETRIKTGVRHFNRDIYGVEWLTGCKTRAKLYCWPCLLFSREKNVLNSSGFSDLNNIHKVIKRHSSCKNHLHCILKLKISNSNPRIEPPLDEQMKICHDQHNEMVQNSHEILKRLIHVICFLGSHDLSFHDHDESHDSINRENYTDMVHFLAKYDPVFSNLPQNSSVFQGTSNLIKNYLITSVSSIILSHIKQEISESHFVAIVLDETIDVGIKSQLSKIICFVTKEGTVEERFLGFEDITSHRTAEALYGVICDIVNGLECGDKLIAYSYDGASMMSGDLGELQTKIKHTFPNALFVHRIGNILNLFLSHSTSKIKECKTFFMTLVSMANFFLKSSKCCIALDNELKKKRLPKVASTIWNNNSRLVQAVHDYRQPLISLFEHIVEGGGDWDTEIETASRGYLNLLKRDFNFNLLLQIYSQIFPKIEYLFNVLQTKINDIGFCIKRIDDFKSFLTATRENGFDSIWDHVINIDDIAEPRSKRLRLDDAGDLKTCYCSLFYEIIDNIQEQINSRFSTFENLKFLELTNFVKHCRVFPEKTFDCLIHSYGSFFDTTALHSELNVIYNVTEGVNKHSVKDLLLFIREKNLEKAYSQLLKLCQLVMTIPATNSSTGCSPSTLKRIKTYLRNTMSQEILSNTAILSIEKALIKELSGRPTFYDSVIADFEKERKIPLQYK